MPEQNAKKIYSSPSEAEFNSNREKLEEAIEQFEKNLLLDIRMYLRNLKLPDSKEHAEEIFSVVKITALRNAGNYDSDNSARAWLRQAAFYKIQHLYRDGKKQPRTTSISSAAMNCGFDGNIENASESELFDYLEQKSVDRFFRENQMNADEILSVVNADDRKLLKMRFISGYSTKEIAAHYGISDNAADVRLSRAKNRLQREFLK
jgi:RNA polymerase sigma factor (sigma-70 family)